MCLGGVRTGKWWLFVTGWVEQHRPSAVHFAFGMLIAGYWFTENVKAMSTLDVGHTAPHKPLPLQLQNARHCLWGQQRQGTLDLICILHWIQHLCYDTTVQVFHFPFVLSLCCCQRRVTTECEISQCLHMPMIFLQLHLLDGVVFFFFNGYSGVTQQLKGKTFKYLMSLNCSKTEIIVFLQLWVT